MDKPQAIPIVAKTQPTIFILFTETECHRGLQKHSASIDNNIKK